MLLLLAIGFGCSEKDAPEVVAEPTSGGTIAEASGGEEGQDEDARARPEEGKVGKRDALMKQPKKAEPVEQLGARSNSVQDLLVEEEAVAAGSLDAPLRGSAGAAAPTTDDGLAQNQGVQGARGRVAEGLGGLGTRGTGAGGGGSFGAKGKVDPNNRTGTGQGYGRAGTPKPVSEAPRPDQTAHRTPMAPPRAATEWGGRVWLSNDDAMSLASPQRLLAALDQGRGIRPADIRPHEFLNYFSFDTAKPKGDSLFAVEASARRIDDETLTVAIEVAAATPKRRPLDLTLVIDRSGSMSDQGKMDFLKRGLTKLSGHLAPGDIVRIVSFDDRVETPLAEHRVGVEPSSTLARAIDQLSPRGSTDLNAGLREGLHLARSGGAEHERRVLLITDALLNTGQVDPGVVSEMGKAMRESGVHVSAVGVGADVNDKVLDMISEQGHGAYVFLGSAAVVDRVFGPMFPSLVNTVAEDVRASVTLPPSLGMKRFYGEEMSRDKADVEAVSIHAGRAQLYLQDLRVADWDAAQREHIGFHLEWTDVHGQAHSMERSFPVASLLGSDTRDLDKARALMAWTDEITNQARGVGTCGPDYGTWRRRKGTVGNDAELAWLDKLVTGKCGGREPVEPVAVKVKIDTDQPIAEVQLSCAGSRWAETLGAADTVARFNAAAGGRCEVTLFGNTPMAAMVQVPSTGGEVRCRVRAGAMDCAG